MSLIEWKKEFSVGVASVDHEHQEMIALINELHDVMQAQDGIDRVIELLGEIFAQISAHFALEEKIMRDSRYEELESHKNDHESLLDQLLDIIDGVEDTGRYDEEELAARLEHWFSEHFRTHDAKLHKKLG